VEGYRRLLDDALLASRSENREQASGDTALHGIAARLRLCYPQWRDGARLRQRRLGLSPIRRTASLPDSAFPHRKAGWCDTYTTIKSADHLSREAVIVRVEIGASDASRRTRGMHGVG
jgi:hypothetical protein